MLEHLVLQNNSIEIYVYIDYIYKNRQKTKKKKLAPTIIILKLPQIKSIKIQKMYTYTFQLPMQLSMPLQIPVSVQLAQIPGFVNSSMNTFMANSGLQTTDQIFYPCQYQGQSNYSDWSSMPMGMNITQPAARQENQFTTLTDSSQHFNLPTYGALGTVIGQDQVYKLGNSYDNYELLIDNNAFNKGRQPTDSTIFQESQNQKLRGTIPALHSQLKNKPKSSKLLRPKKNVQSNISNQVFSYITNQQKSQAALSKLLKNNKQKIQLYYSYIESFTKSKKKYLSRKYLGDLCIFSADREECIEISERGQLDIFSLEQFRSAIGYLIFHYLREKCTQNVLTSMKLSSQLRREHLERKRQILSYLEEYVRPQYKYNR